MNLSDSMKPLSKSMPAGMDKTSKLQEGISKLNSDLRSLSEGFVSAIVEGYNAGELKGKGKISSSRSSKSLIR